MRGNRKYGNGYGYGSTTSAGYNSNDPSNSKIVIKKKSRGYAQALNSRGMSTKQGSHRANSLSIPKPKSENPQFANSFTSG